MSHNLVASALSRFFEVEEINGAEVCPTYMYRWQILSLFGWKAYIHRFVADDWSLDLHDHPKRFISIGLWGSYVEHYPCDSPERGLQHSANCNYGRDPRFGLIHNQPYDAPWIRSFSANHIHRLSGPSYERPCWTLVIVGRPTRQWGFWHFWKHGREWTPWRKYVGSELASRMKACE